MFAWLSCQLFHSDIPNYNTVGPQLHTLVS